MSKFFKYSVLLAVGFSIGFNVMGALYIFKGVPAPSILSKERAECQADLPRSQKCVARVYWEVQ